MEQRTASQADDAAASTFVAEASLMLPLGCVGVLAVLCFLGPYLVRLTGVPGDSATLVEQVFLTAAVWRWPAVAAGLLVLAAALGSLYSAAARQILTSSGTGFRALAKLGLFVPLAVAIGLLLMGVVSPVIRALSGVGQ